MKTIDLSGLTCPMPLIQTKKALKENIDLEAIKLVIDNKAAYKNVSRFLQDNKIDFQHTEEGDKHILIVNQISEELVIEDAESSCSTKITYENPYIIVLAKDRLGEGSLELGKMLVEGMLNTIMEMKKKPEKIIFLNSGINLVVAGSTVIEILKQIEEVGTELLVCGNCLNYFGKVDELLVGKVSNALEIFESMTGSAKIINI